MQNDLSRGGNDSLDGPESQDVASLLKHPYASQYLAFTSYVECRHET